MGEREAELELDHLAGRDGREDQLEAAIRDAHVAGDETRAEQLEQELLELEQVRIPRAERRRDGLAERVAQARQARMRFVAEHEEVLLAELEPQLDAARERLEQAAHELLEADSAWTEARLAREAILRSIPDNWTMAQRRPPPRHGLEHILSELRRAGPVRSPADTHGVVIRAPTPGGG